ncbi:hypothetical protein BH160DRAFT_5155 [Burkholderia sp. H160]|nr:hypothetical protein BH160DRAFT_5155 [Burkholderia sp. H160]
MVGSATLTIEVSRTDIVIAMAIAMKANARWGWGRPSVMMQAGRKKMRGRLHCCNSDSPEQG